MFNFNLSNTVRYTKSKVWPISNVANNRKKSVYNCINLLAFQTCNGAKPGASNSATDTE